MVKSSIRRPVIWMLLVGLLVLVCALSACGDSGAASTPATTPTTSSTSASPTTQPTPSAATITIREKTGGQDIYTFDPASVTIKAGQTITFDNKSDEYHQLILTDATGKPVTGASPFTTTTIVPTSRASATTTLQVTFPMAGTYHYTSKLVNRLKDGQHPEGELSQGKGTIIVK